MIISSSYEDVEIMTFDRGVGVKNLSEVVASLYKKVHGYCWKLFTTEEVSDNLFDNTPMNEVLEIIDEYRIPLAEKRLDREELTEKELTYLEILDSLTDSILSGIAPEPSEPLDVKLALEYAKKLSPGING